MQDLRFSQRCFRRVKSSSLWCHVISKIGTNLLAELAACV